MVNHSSNRPWVRKERVAPAIRAVVCDFLLRRIKDPRVHGVEVSHVDVSPDLRSARVHYLIREEGVDREQLQQGLDSSAGAIQKVLSDTLRMRHTPRIQFLYDDLVDEARRIDRILEEIQLADSSREDG